MAKSARHVISWFTDFLDVTFDLRKKEHQPYAKPGNTPRYVHIDSNHPPTIAKQIPKSIESRLSTISSNKDIFDRNKPEYEKALQRSGHQTKLQYQPAKKQTPEEPTQQNKRTRNITWFNPPYSAHVKTNIGKQFLKLIERHFPPNHELHKICNKNTVKLSYSCMDSMAKIIKGHNSKLTKPEENKRSTCNCRKKEDCPLPGKCTTSNVIYETKVSTTDCDKTYIGLTANTFKTRFTAHKSSFMNRDKESSTELSKYIWKLKDKHTPYQITWRILQQAQPYSPTTKRCNLCLWEKYHIIRANKENTLNSRSELISTCRHRRKFLLSELW